MLATMAFFHRMHGTGSNNTTTKDYQMRNFPRFLSLFGYILLQFFRSFSPGSCTRLENIQYKPPAKSYSNSLLFYPSKFMPKAQQLVLGPCVSNAPLSAISDLTCFKTMSDQHISRERFSVGSSFCGPHPTFQEPGDP